MLDEVFNIKPRYSAEYLTIDAIESVAQTDDALVAGALDGDETAFAEIFERHKKRVGYVVARYFRRSPEIEEFVQQTFTKAYFSLKKYRGGETHSFRTWLTRIAVNVCYDEFRRRERHGENLFAEMSDDELEYLETLNDGKTPSPDKKVLAATLLEKILSGLNADERMAMTLVYSHEYSVSEAADALGVSVSNLKSRMFRCRNKLRARFGYLFK